VKASGEKSYLYKREDTQTPKKKRTKKKKEKEPISEPELLEEEEILYQDSTKRSWKKKKNQKEISVRLSEVRGGVSLVREEKAPYSI